MSDAEGRLTTVEFEPSAAPAASNGTPTAHSVEGQADLTAGRTTGGESTAPAQAISYFANIYPGGNQAVSAELGKCVAELEQLAGMPVWLLIQDESDPRNPWTQLDVDVFEGFFDSRALLQAEKPVMLVVQTPGGSAKAAYQIAKLFRNHCGGFTAVVPRAAKSAGTLLVLGADQIVLAEDAELGPLDAQVMDFDREEYSSALDEVQALERLQAFALQAVDVGVLMFTRRSGKKIGTVLPGVQHFVADMTRPLFEKIDTVHYTQMSRILKVAEEYAVRLLQPRYPKQNAEEIARALVHKYPEHDFFIDAAEAGMIGLSVERPPANQAKCLDRLMSLSRGRTIIGRIQARTV